MGFGIPVFDLTDGLLLHVMVITFQIGVVGSNPKVVIKYKINKPDQIKINNRLKNLSCFFEFS